MPKKILLILFSVVLIATAVSAHAAITSYLTFGSRGSQVTELQNRLTQLGFYNGPVTGYFGVLTRAAVIKFQAAHNIPQLGVVGPMTRAALNKPSDSSLSISSLSPSYGPVEATVTIKGSGFTKNSFVNFDTQRVTPAFINSTTLTFVVPSYVSPYCPPGAVCALYVKEVTPGNYPVTISNGTITSNTVTFIVTSGALSITSITPSSGRVGTTVTLTGTGFTPTGNKIKFGDLGSENNPAYSLNSSDGKTIIFTVPLSDYMACWNSTPACSAPAQLTQPGSYSVSVINAKGTSNQVIFTVTNY